MGKKRQRRDGGKEGRDGGMEGARSGEIDLLQVLRTSRTGAFLHVGVVGGIGGWHTEKDGEKLSSRKKDEEKREVKIKQLSHYVYHAQIGNLYCMDAE